MDNNITALQALYVALGGSLTDTYSTICNGAPVSNYVTIPDMINAVAKKAAGAGIELPDAPTTNGTYVLQCVKSDSGATYSWVANEAELPTVTASNNGEVLKVVNGAWAAADEAELPTVTTDENGKVLTVVSGAWAAASLPS